MTPCYYRRSEFVYFLHHLDAPATSNRGLCNAYHPRLADTADFLAGKWIDLDLVQVDRIDCVKCCLPAPEPDSFRACLFTENRSLIFNNVVRADLKRIFLRSVAKTFRASEGCQGCLLLHRTPPLIELVILLLLYNAKIVKVQFFKTA